MCGHYFGSDSNEQTVCIIEENRKTRILNGYLRILRNYY